MQYLGVFPGSTQQPGESQILLADIWHRRGVCSANSVCSTALLQLKICCSTRKIKVLSASLILKDLCWSCCLTDTSSRDGLWRAGDQPCCDIADGPGQLQWGPGPWGSPRREVRVPQTHDCPQTLAGFFKFQVTWAGFQVPVRASLCGFKSLTLGTGMWIFQSEYLKIKCLHSTYFTGFHKSSIFYPWGHKYFSAVIQNIFGVFFSLYNFMLPSFWPFNLITKVFQGHPLSIRLHCLSRYRHGAEPQVTPTISSPKPQVGYFSPVLVFLVQLSVSFCFKWKCIHESPQNYYAYANT